MPKKKALFLIEPTSEVHGDPTLLHNQKNIANPNDITLNDFSNEIIMLTETKQKNVYLPLQSEDPK